MKTNNRTTITVRTKDYTMNKVFFAFITAFFISCSSDNSPVQAPPPSALEDRINSIAAIDYISIKNAKYASEMNLEFSTTLDPNAHILKKAYASNGYLIVESEATYAFTLSTARTIKIAENGITVVYE